MTVIENEVSGAHQLFVATYSTGDTWKDVTRGRSSYTWEARSNARRPRPQGWLYPQGYSMSHVHIVETSGNWGFTFPPGQFFLRMTRVGLLNFQYGTVYDGPTSVPSNIQSDGLLQTQLKVKDIRVSLGQALAEAGKTADLVADTANFCADAYMYLRTRNWKKLKSLTGWDTSIAKKADSSASAWLQYRYGWTPLLNDVYGSMSALVKANHEVPSTKVTHTQKEMVDKLLIVGKDTDYARELHTGGIVSRFVRFDFIPNGGLTSALQSVDLTNPLSIAWELVPYSFVVDWFIPIGMALSAADYATGITWKSGSISDWIDCTTTTRSRPDLSTEGVYGSCKGAHKRKYLERVPLIYPPAVPLPSFRSPFPNGKRVADSMALLIKAFSGNTAYKTRV